MKRLPVYPAVLGAAIALTAGQLSPAELAKDSIMGRFARNGSPPKT
jgi:hypothetical protein